MTGFWTLLLRYNGVLRGIFKLFNLPSASKVFTVFLPRAFTNTEMKYEGSRFSLDQGPHANVIGPEDASP